MSDDAATLTGPRRTIAAGRPDLKALEDLYLGWKAEIASRSDITIADIRQLFEHWGDVTAEPGDVDYVEETIGPSKALWILPKIRADDRILLCAHGGGYVLGSIYSHRKLYGHFAKRIGCRALIPDYRRAPEHPHPGPLNDVVFVYRWLLDGGRADPAHIAFLGDSAGGGLVLAALLQARSLGVALPAAAIALAPYLDMEARGESYRQNDQKDKLGSREATLQFVEIFLGADGDRRDPLANPLHADLTGLPPILLQVGGFDVLLDDSRDFHAKAIAAGLDATLEVWAEMQHVFHFLAGHAPEADDAIQKAARWVRPKLGLEPIGG